LRLQSDERLLRLAREGHPPAFTAIVDRYRAALQRYCARLVGDQRAEDAVQQAFANAHRAMTERDDVIQLRPWLYRIAHNAALNTLRGETAGWSLDDPDAPDIAALGGEADDVESAVVRREHLHDTLAAISSLPAQQRDALLLRELEGRSHVEIADVLGVTAGAARQHLMRARAAVRAAATAITPYPLLTKLITWMTFTPTGERVTQVAAGAGLGAGLVKVSAGVLATGALVGGAVGTGVAPSLPGARHDDPKAATRQAVRATTSPAATPATSARAIGAVGPAGAAVPVSHVAGRGRAPHPAATPARRGSQDSAARSPAPATPSGGDDAETERHPGDDGRPAAQSPSRHGSGSEDASDPPETSGSAPAPGSGHGDDDQARTSDDRDEHRPATITAPATLPSTVPARSAERPEAPDPPETDGRTSTMSSPGHGAASALADDSDGG
jgi:RNA polymerase sigma factor (sigma-70 family)